MKKIKYLFLISVIASSIVSAGPPAKNFSGNVPPGLRGKSVPGLQNPGKIPSGWTHGQKTGWTKVWDKNLGKWRWVKIKP